MCDRQTEPESLSLGTTLGVGALPIALEKMWQRLSGDSLARIAHQQLNGTAAKTILGRVRALYPGKRFPGPEDLLGTPDERLRLLETAIERMRNTAMHLMPAQPFQHLVLRFTHMTDCRQIELMRELQLLVIEELLTRIVESGHEGLASGAIEHIHFQVHEALCRHLFNSVEAMVRDYQAELIEARADREC